MRPSPGHAASAVRGDDPARDLHAAHSHSTAKDSGLRAANAIAQARNLVGHALGRQAAGAQLISAIHAKEKSLLGRVMEIDTFATPPSSRPG
jgi:hypothetical protein